MRDREAEARAGTLRPFFDQANDRSQGLAAAAGEEGRRQTEERAARQAAARKAVLDAEAARDEEIRKEIADRRRAEQARADAALKEELRAAFMGHPAATEADFEAAWPRLRQEHMEREALVTGSTFAQELAIARRRHPSLL